MCAKRSRLLRTCRMPTRWREAPPQNRDELNQSCGDAGLFKIWRSGSPLSDLRRTLSTRRAPLRAVESVFAELRRGVGDCHGEALEFGGHRIGSRRVAGIKLGRG